MDMNSSYSHWKLAPHAKRKREGDRNNRLSKRRNSVLPFLSNIKLVGAESEEKKKELATDNQIYQGPYIMGNPEQYPQPYPGRPNETWVEQQPNSPKVRRIDPPKIREDLYNPNYNCDTFPFKRDENPDISVQRSNSGGNPYPRREYRNSFSYYEGNAPFFGGEQEKATAENFSASSESSLTQKNEENTDPPTSQIPQENTSQENIDSFYSSFLNANPENPQDSSADRRLSFFAQLQERRMSLGRRPSVAGRRESFNRRDSIFGLRRDSMSIRGGNSGSFGRKDSLLDPLVIEQFLGTRKFSFGNLETDMFDLNSMLLT